MASSVSAPVVVPQATKRTHAEMSSSEIPSQQNQPLQSSLQAEAMTSSSSSVPSSKTVEPKVPSESRAPGYAACRLPAKDPMLVNSNASPDLHLKENAIVISSAAPNTMDTEPIKQSQKSMFDAAKTTTETVNSAQKLIDGVSHTVEVFNGDSALSTSKIKETKTEMENASQVPTSYALAPSSQHISESGVTTASESDKSALEPNLITVAASVQDATEIANIETAASQFKSVANKTSTSTKSSSDTSNTDKIQLEYGEEPEKKAKVVPNTGKAGGRTPEQILEYMDKTFEQRRKIITKQMPSIPELKELYPDLFMGKQLLIEFQRITKIDIDQKIQEFCVRYATAVIEMARSKKGAAPVLARWEQAKQENDTLRQYWDMVTALCLLPLHFGENFVEMVLEIGEDEEVVAQGKIVPTLVARGNIFRTDEFFLIAENTIVQEFEEFTIAFASLYSSYWVFNMVYPETIEDTYNYIQRCIVRQREPGSIPTACKNFTKALLKWNKGKEGK